MILMRYSLQIEHSLRLCFQPPLTVPWTSGFRAIKTVRPPAPCAAGAALHRLCRRRPPEKCPRGLGQGSNAAAAHVAKVADRSSSGRTVDSCGAEIVGRFNFSELPYNLPRKNTPTFKLLTISHHAFLLAT